MSDRYGSDSSTFRFHPRLNGQIEEHETEGAKLSESLERLEVYDSLTQPTTAGQEREQELLDWAKEFGAKRAEILLSGTSDRAELEALDRSLTVYLAECGSVVRDNPAILEDFYNTIRSEQDRFRFESLKQPFEKLGYHLGLCQGREIDKERLERLNDSTERLFEQTYEKHKDLFQRFDASQSVSQGGDLQYERAPLPDMREALIASLHEGEQEGILKRIDCDAKAAEVASLIGRLKQRPPFCWLANVRDLRKVFDGVSLQDIRLVDEQFQEREGESLMEAASKTYNSFDTLLSRHVLRKNKVGVIAHEMYDAIRGWKTNRSRFGLLREIYRTNSSHDLQSAERFFNRYYGPKFSKKSLEQLISKKLTQEQRSFMKLRRENEDLAAEATVLPELILGKRDDMYEACSILEQYRDKGELHDLVQKFLEVNTIDIEECIAASKGKSYQKDLLRGILHEDERLERAAQLRCAIEDSSIWVAKPFLDKSDEERKQLVDNYVDIYARGDQQVFWDDIDRASLKLDFGPLARFPSVCKKLQKLRFLFRDSRPFVYSVIKTGDMADGELMRFFMEGLGSDDSGIRALLAGKSLAEIDKIRKDYSERYPGGQSEDWIGKLPGLRNFVLLGDMDHDIATEVSGDDLFDIQRLLAGREETPEQVYQSVKDRFHHETSGKLMRRIKNMKICRQLPTYRMVSDDVKRCLEYYHKHFKGKQNPSEAEFVRFMALSRFAEQSLDVFRKNKSSATKLTSNYLAFAGATVGAVPGMLFGWPYALIAGGAISGSYLVRSTLQKLFSGDAYGREEKAFDIVRAVVDGGSLLTLRLGQVSAVTLTALARIFGASIGKGVMQTGVKLSLHTAVASVESRIRKQDKAKLILDEIEGPLLFDGPEKRIQEFLDNVENAVHEVDQSTQTSLAFENAFRQGMWAAFRGRQMH